MLHESSYRASLRSEEWPFEKKVYEVLDYKFSRWETKKKTSFRFLFYFLNSTITVSQNIKEN